MWRADHRQTPLQDIVYLYRKTSARFVQVPECPPVCFLLLRIYTRGRLLAGKKEEEVCHPAMRIIMMQQAMQHLASIVLLVADIKE